MNPHDKKKVERTKKGLLIQIKNKEKRRLARISRR